MSESLYTDPTDGTQLIAVEDASGWVEVWAARGVLMPPEVLPELRAVLARVQVVATARQAEEDRAEAARAAGE